MELRELDSLFADDGDGASEDLAAEPSFSGRPPVSFDAEMTSLDAIFDEETAVHEPSVLDRGDSAPEAGATSRPPRPARVASHPARSERGSSILDPDAASIHSGGRRSSVASSLPRDSASLDDPMARVLQGDRHRLPESKDDPSSIVSSDELHPLGNEEVRALLERELGEPYPDPLAVLKAWRPAHVPYSLPPSLRATVWKLLLEAVCPLPKWVPSAAESVSLALEAGLGLRVVNAALVEQLSKCAADSWLPVVGGIVQRFAPQAVDMSEYLLRLKDPCKREAILLCLEDEAAEWNNLGEDDCGSGFARVDVVPTVAPLPEETPGGFEWFYAAVGRASDAESAETRRMALMGRRVQAGSQARWLLLRQLLFYHDPELAMHLDTLRPGWNAPSDCGGCIPPCWFSSLFLGAGGLEVDSFVRLVDLLLGEDAADACDVQWGLVLTDQRVALAKKLLPTSEEVVAVTVASSAAAEGVDLLDDDVDLWKAASPEEASDPSALPVARPSLSGAVLPLLLSVAVLEWHKTTLMALRSVGPTSGMDFLSATLKKAAMRASEDPPDSIRAGEGLDHLWKGVLEMARKTPVSASMNALRAWAMVSAVPIRALGVGFRMQATETQRREALASVQDLLRQRGAKTSPVSSLERDPRGWPFQSDAVPLVAALSCTIPSTAVPGPESVPPTERDLASKALPLSTGSWLFSTDPVEWTEQRRLVLEALGREISLLREKKDLPRVGEPLSHPPEYPGSPCLLLEATEAASALCRSSGASRRRILGLKGSAALEANRRDVTILVLDVRPKSFRERGSFGAAFHVNCDSIPADVGAAAAVGAASLSEWSEAVEDGSVSGADAKSLSGMPLAEAIRSLLGARGLIHVAVMGVGCRDLWGFFPSTKFGAACERDDSRVAGAIAALHAAGFPLVSQVRGGYASVVRLVRRAGAVGSITGFSRGACPVSLHAATVTHAKALRALALASVALRIGMGPSVSERAEHASRAVAQAVGKSAGELVTRVNQLMHRPGSEEPTSGAPQWFSGLKSALKPSEVPTAPGGKPSALGWMGATRNSIAAAASRATASLKRDSGSSRMMGGIRSLWGRGSASSSEPVLAPPETDDEKFAIDDDDEEEGDAAKSPVSKFGPLAPCAVPTIASQALASIAPGTAHSLKSLVAVAVGGMDASEEVLRGIDLGGCLVFDARLKDGPTGACLLTQHRLLLVSDTEDGSVQVEFNWHVTELMRAKYGKDSSSEMEPVMLRVRSLLDKDDGWFSLSLKGRKVFLAALVDTLRGYQP
jgi:hypothetical protein